MQKRTGAKIHVGCGDDKIPGTVGCDLRKTPNVDVVCAAWQVNDFFTEAKSIFSRHMLEHLTFEQVIHTLHMWFCCLAQGGVVKIIVPDMDFHIAQWQNAAWTGEEWRKERSNARWSSAGFWGWQRETGVRHEGLSPTDFWDVHKSGFNKDSLCFFLRGAGFSDITCKNDGHSLVALAFKRMQDGERQIAMDLSGIRNDHLGRYIFAAKHIPEESSILDAACGIGYGSYYLCKAIQGTTVTGVDIDEHAIEYANTFYLTPGVSFLREDILSLDGTCHDAIVSFETVEHIPDIASALASFHKKLNRNGIFICSTPNESTMPHSHARFPYHVRHYTPEEFRTLLGVAGFTDCQFFSQHSSESADVRMDTDGLYLLAVCSK